MPLCFLSCLPSAFGHSLLPVSFCSSPDCFNCCHLCLLFNLPTSYFSSILILHSQIFRCVTFMTKSHLLELLHISMHLSVCISFVLPSFYTNLFDLIPCASPFALLSMVIVSQSFMCPVSLVCVWDQICFPFVVSGFYIQMSQKSNPRIIVLSKTQTGFALGSYCSIVVVGALFRKTSVETE